MRSFRMDKLGIPELTVAGRAAEAVKRKQKALTMRAGGATLSEIATELGITESGASRILSRAQQRCDCEI